MYERLNQAAIFLVPVGPAFYFGFHTYKDLISSEIHPLIAFLVGFCMAGALELIGIVAGHLAVEFADKGKYVHSLVASLILVSYVVLGVSGLQDILDKTVAVFLLAPLGYLLMGMHKSNRDTGIQQTNLFIHEQQRREQQEDEDRAHKHELAIRRQTLKHEKEMAKLTAQPAAQIPAQVSPKKRTKLSKDEAKLAIVSALQENPGQSQRDLAELVGISKGSVGNYTGELLGEGILVKNGNGLTVK